jgi:hypothetical protein
LAAGICLKLKSVNLPMLGELTRGLFNAEGNTTFC